MLQKNFFIILMFSAFFSCHNTESKAEFPAKKPQKKATIITENTQNEAIIVRKLNSINNLEGNIITSTKNRDTLSLPIKECDIILISSKLTYKDTLLVKQGDTVKLAFENNKMRFQENANINPFSETIDNNFINKIEKKTKRLWYRYFTIDTVNRLNLSIKNNYEKIKMSNGRLVIKKDLIKKEKDSLTELANLYFQLASEKKKYFLNKVENGLLTESELKIVSDQVFSNAYRKVYLTYKYSKIESIREKLISNEIVNDSLLTSDFRYYIFNQYLNLLKEDLKNTDKPFMNLFEKLPEYITGKLLEEIRILCLYQMVNWDEPFNNILECYNEYVKIHGQNLFIKEFEKRNLINLKSLNNLPEDLVLYNQTGLKSTIDELIYKYKGKVVYIDFWASWCAPCISAMPASLVLQKEYKNEDVVFLYLSIDKDTDKWEKSSKRQQLFSNDNNYLVLNFETANYAKDLNIATIPRYLLYNKRGKLIHQNAPSPKSKEIKKYIDDLLNKKSLE